jgi:hypothetical protein
MCLVMRSFINFCDPIPIYQEVAFEAEEIPFDLPRAKREIEKEGEGKSSDLRWEKIEIIPHSHVTHLETKGHLDGILEKPPIYLNEPLLTRIIDENAVFSEGADENVQFVIIKKGSPKKRKFTGLNLEIIGEILKKYPKILVLGINEPSFDPEEDDGSVSAHKLVFEFKKMYLIELLNLEYVKPGRYYCFLNLFRYGLTDAYPCSPVLYRIPAEMVLSDSCLFCKIIRGIIPSFKVYETNLTYAFLDINPLSEGHIVSSTCILS